MNLIVAELRLGLVEFNSTFIINIVNAVVMYLIMKRYLFKPVQKMLADRENEIKNQYSDAQKVEDNAKALKEKYEAKLADVETEGIEILNEYKKRANENAKNIVMQAEAEAQKIREKGKKDIEDELSKTVYELKNELSELAVLAASQVVEKQLDQNDHTELIDNLISEVGDVKWQN